MAKSKFAGIFEQPATQEPEPRQPTEDTPPPAAPAEPRTARPIGRPPGKRSDPAWKQFSVLLKKQTQREAMTALRAKQQEDEVRDLSGLLQELLEQWVAARRRD